MSIADRVLFPGESRVSVSIANPRDPVIADWFGGRSNTAAGISVTPEKSMQMIAVYAAISIIADSIASLPLSVYQRNGAGKDPKPDHAISILLQRQPNDWQTAFEFREMMQGHVLLRGNAYAEIISSTRNAVEKLIPLHPDRVIPFIAPNGKIAYSYEPLNEKKRIILQEEMFHLRGLSSDGIIGLSPIQLAKNAIAVGLAAEEFGARFFGNGTSLGGVLEHPQKLSDEAYERLRESWYQRHQGLANSNKPAILEEGMKWQAIGVNPDEAQFLETRKFQVSEIARLFRVPPHLIGDVERTTSWGTGLEQMNIGFVQFSLMPWMIRWEQTGNKNLFTNNEKNSLFLKHKVEGLLRGDSTARGDFYSKMFNMGAYSVNDILGLEDRNPVDGGDQRFVPLNMIPLNEASQAQSQNSGRANKIIDAEIRRIARKEVRAVERAIKGKKDNFIEWASEFYRDHVDYVAEVLVIDPDMAEQYANETQEELIRCINEKDSDGLNLWAENRANKLRAFAELKEDIFDD